jgi:hypothetical protein
MGNPNLLEGLLMSTPGDQVWRPARIHLKTIGSTTTQAVGNRLAQGTTGTYASGACTGKPQQVTEIAAVNVSGAPFRPGIAMIQASVGDCPKTTPNCSGASTERVLSILAD